MPPLNRISQEGTSGSYGSQRSSFGSLSSLPEQQYWKPPPTTLSPLKRARFSDEVRTHPVMPRAEYTSEEISNSWYTRNDFSTFRRDVCATAFMANSNPHKIDDRSYTMRGAEHRLVETGMRRMSYRTSGRAVVLNNKPLYSNLIQADWVAYVYHQASAASVHEALYVASLDEVEACRHQKEVPKEHDFNDDWISALSIEPTHPSVPPQLPRHSFEELINLDDDSGFDDSWLRDSRVAA